MYKIKVVVMSKNSKKTMLRFNLDFGPLRKKHAWVSIHYIGLLNPTILYAIFSKKKLGKYYMLINSR